ncbi:MAG: bifunctional folylpolyglutamate synthase/dihydrofolate synthase, partial [Candidatus Altiarchaeales archaeon ex4484_96]
MDYNAALSYIEGFRGAGINLRLDNIRVLLDKLGNPHQRLKCIHVAGSNGKGSVCAMTDSILKSEGYKTGLYTSPHLVDFRERIQINNRMITEKQLASLVSEMKPEIDEMNDMPVGPPSYFEVVTALSLFYFMREEVDYAVVEVGLGGRLDATNVLNSLVCVVTNVSMDHMKYLGDTIEEIAGEKAQIIKKNTILVTAADEPAARGVLMRECMLKDARFVLVDERSFMKLYLDIRGGGFDYLGPYGIIRSLQIPLLGEHQLINAATAISSVKALGEYGIKISDEAIRDGLMNASWPGRLEVVADKPTILLDAAHNPASFTQLKKALSQLFTYERLYLVTAVSAGKDYVNMISQIAPLVHQAVVTGLSEVEHVSRGDLAAEYSKHGVSVMEAPDMRKALDVALSKAKKNDVVCVA